MYFLFKLFTFLEDDIMAPTCSTCNEHECEPAYDSDGQPTGTFLKECEFCSFEREHDRVFGTKYHPSSNIIPNRTITPVKNKLKGSNSCK